MCGAYGFTATKEELQKRFEIEGDIPEIKPRYNVRPTQTMPTILHHSPKSVALMHWGFVEPWSRDGKAKLSLFNARDDRVKDSKLFSHALRFGRCLVPARFFYEFKKTVQGSMPFMFSLKDDSLFSFAGLHSEYHFPDGKVLPCYTIITTAANALVKDVHPRMPVILRKEDEDAYLDPDTIEPERILPLLRSYPAKEMRSQPVSRDVNSYRNDRPDLIEAVKSDPPLNSK